MEYLILNLNKRSGTYFSHFNIETLTVLLSRVKRLDNVFRLPFYEEKTMDVNEDTYLQSQMGYLTELSNDPYRSIWYQCWKKLNPNDIEQIWKPMESTTVQYLLKLSKEIEKRTTNRNKKQQSDYPNFDYQYEMAYQSSHKQLISLFNEVLMEKITTPDIKTLDQLKATYEIATELRDKNKINYYHGPKSKASKGKKSTSGVKSTKGKGVALATQSTKVNSSMPLATQMTKMTLTRAPLTTEQQWYVNSFWNNMEIAEVNRYESIRKSCRTPRQLIQQPRFKERGVAYIVHENQYEIVRESDFVTITHWLNSTMIEFFMILWASQRPINFIEKVVVLDSFWYSSQLTHYERHKSISDDRHTNLYKRPNTPYYARHLESTTIITFVANIGEHWILIVIQDGICHNFDGFHHYEQRGTFEYIINNWWEREHRVLNKPHTPLTFNYHDNYGTTPESDIIQNDGISCGVSAIMHAYYVIVLNRFATYRDFNFDYMPRIRKFLGYTIYSKGHMADVTMKILSVIKAKVLQESILATHLFMRRALNKDTILVPGEDDDVIHVNQVVTIIEDENTNVLQPNIISQESTEFGKLIEIVNKMPSNLKQNEKDAYFDDIIFLN